MPYYYLDVSWYLFVLPAFVLALWAQQRVKSTFRRYRAVPTLRGMTGAEAARYLLDARGLSHVRVERIAGSLTDHYDPRTQTVRLSDPVFGSATVAAVGVAAHECGHAFQHAEGYGPLRLRNAIIPVTNLGSSLAIPIFVLGLLFNYKPVMALGLLLFSLMAVFQLVTLPVEYNASRRAIATVDERGLLTPEETAGARRMLSAAALTYVAALASTMAQLGRLVLISRRRD